MSRRSSSRAWPSDRGNADSRCIGRRRIVRPGEAGTHAIGAFLKQQRYEKRNSIQGIYSLDGDDMWRGSRMVGQTFKISTQSNFGGIQNNETVEQVQQDDSRDGRGSDGVRRRDDDRGSLELPRGSAGERLVVRDGEQPDFGGRRARLRHGHSAGPRAEPPRDGHDCAAGCRQRERDDG